MSTTTRQTARARGVSPPRAAYAKHELRRPEAVRPSRRAGLVAIKTVHTAAFFSIGSCLAYFAYAAVRKRSDRRAAIAGAVVTGEALVYAANGFRCPLTDLAEQLGSEHGSVADIYLPRWIESHLPFITGPIFAGAAILHARNLIEARRGRSRLDVRSARAEQLEPIGAELGLKAAQAGESG
jgi:hypothetical protein